MGFESVSADGLRFSCANCGVKKHYTHASMPDVWCLSKMPSGDNTGNLLPGPLCVVCNGAVQEALDKVRVRKAGQA